MNNISSKIITEQTKEPPITMQYNGFPVDLLIKESTFNSLPEYECFFLRLDVFLREGVVDALRDFKSIKFKCFGSWYSVDRLNFRVQCRANQVCSVDFQAYLARQ